MRKFLSLVLALVMVMSLVTINAGAKEFTDDGDITYKEAVDVISTIKVVDGYADGGFKPNGNLTRGAAAKIICNLILGPTTAAELHADTAPYRDVPVNHDFAGYIAYCQKEGIVSGYADGTFRPAGTLTGYAFMKMLLGALGYDAEIEGYVGPNWSINVAKKAISIGLNKSLEGEFNGVNYITREEAALYAFNTLRSDLVQYEQKITANVNGAEVTVGNSNAESRKWNSQQTRYDSIRKDNIVQFAEEYFNKLVLKEDMDVFGRPDREWRYDGDLIGEYINTDLLKEEYTTEVTGKELRDLLGATVVDDYDFEIHVDGLDTVDDKGYLDGNDNSTVYSFTQGNLIRTNTKGVGGTGKGVLTQVFVDNDKDVEKVYIAVINTYLAKATDDYNEKKEEAEFEVYSLEDVDDNNNSFVLVKNTNDYKGDADKCWTTDLTVKNEDINVEDVKEDDIVLVRVADGEIQEIIDPEVISDTEITSFKNGSWVKADEQYDYAHSAGYDPEVLDQYVNNNMKDTTYNLYLDPYGYMIGIEIVEAKTNYLFLTGIDGKTSNLANKTAEGNVILLDGTMDTVTIKLNDSRYADGEDMTDSVAHPLNSLMNTWCKYTTNKNGAYVLTEIARTQTQFDALRNKAGQSHVGDTTASHIGLSNYGIIDKKHVSTQGIAGSNVKMAYGTDDTVYLAVTTGLITATKVSAAIPSTDSSFIINDVDSVVVGVQNANLEAFSAYDVWNAATNKGNIANATQVGSNVKQLGSIANGVYNLFDTDGALIAAVVVGEDSGSTTNYAYTISNSMKQEDWNKESEEWTWSREVVINGEIVDVTEVTDGKHPSIESMVRGQWYEMKYKADGTVKSASLIGWDEDLDNTIDTTNNKGERRSVIGEFLAQNDASNIEGSTTKPSKFIGLVRKVESAVEDEDTVVLATDLTGRNPNGSKGNVSVPTATSNYSSINPNAKNVTPGTNVITAQGNTLWIENKVAGQKDGFAVRNDAKIVLVQDTHTIRDGAVVNVSVMDNKYEYSQTGKEALDKMVKDLMDNNNFSGFISAVFEGGVATSVVVWDQTPENINTGNSGGNSGGGQFAGSGEGAYWDNANKTIKLRYYGDLLTDEEIRNYIGNAFNSPVTSMNKFMGTATLADGTVVPVDFSQIEVIKVNLDGELAKYVDVGSALGTITVPVNNGKYMKDVKYLTSSSGVLTASGKTLTVSAGNAVSGTDVDVWTAYELNGLSKTVKSSSGTDVTIADGGYVAPNTVVTVTGTDTSTNYRQFTVTVGGNTTKVGTPAPGVSGTESTMTHTVTADTTFAETVGYMVKVNGDELGVYAAGAMNFNYPGNSTGTIKFVAEKTVPAAKWQYASGELAVSAGATYGTGYSYTVASSDAVDGVINLIPVVAVTTDANVVGTYSYTDTDNSTKTGTIAKNTTTAVYVKVGTVLNLTATDTSDDAHYVALGGDELTGTGCSKSDSTAGTAAKAVYEVVASDLGSTLAFTEGN